MADNWIHTDEVEDVVGSIRHVIRAAEFVDEDAQAWKWVVLALHSALQGACVCHLTGTAAPIGAVTERNTNEWLTYLEESRNNPNAKPPKAYLMVLPDLLKAVRRPHSAGDRSNTSGVVINDAELDWLKRFHDGVRNQYTHFEPMGWAFRHQDVTQREELRRSLNTLTSINWSS